MNRLKLISFIWKMLPLILITMLLSTGVAQASGAWKLIHGVNPSAIYDGLRGVAAVAPNDAWAVGAYSKTQNTHQPLIEHWNGTKWSVVPSPTPDPAANLLYGVAATSAQDAWAVGNYYSNIDSIGKTLIDHWNGTKWTVATSPNPSSSVNGLNGVIALSPGNAWAVGQYTDNISDYTEPLIEQWNGTNWTIVAGPKPGAGEAALVSVSASSANSIWAVGNLINQFGYTQTLIEYWDGTTWSVVPSPNPGVLSNTLSGVTAISASNVWAVGQYESNTSFNTLIEHWNGTQWSVVPSPNPSTSQNALYGVAAVSANNIWTVGQDDQGLGGRTLIEQWNGTTWNVVSSPNQGSGDNTLFAVARVPSTQKAWAVGQYSSSNSQTIFQYHQ